MLIQHKVELTYPEIPDRMLSELSERPCTRPILEKYFALLK